MKKDNSLMGLKVDYLIIPIKKSITINNKEDFQNTEKFIKNTDKKLFCNH